MSRVRVRDSRPPHDILGWIEVPQVVLDAVPNDNSARVRFASSPMTHRAYRTVDLQLQYFVVDGQGVWAFAVPSEDWPEIAKTISAPNSYEETP